MLYIIIGFFFGAALGYLLARMQQASFVAKIATLEQQYKDLTISAQRQAEQVEQQHKAYVEAQEQRHREALGAQEQRNQEALRAQEHRHQEVLKAQERRHSEAVEAMRESFQQSVMNLRTDMKAATEDMLRSRQQEFSDLSQRNIKGIVDPLNENIARMKEAMDGYAREQSAFGGSLKTNLDAILKSTAEAQRSAVELTTALKHDIKVQGDYGEAILDEILSKQGFTEGVHYELQYVMKDENGRALKDEEGSGLRPDVLFHLDTVRDVIIDSKVSLTDFINFANATTPEERTMYLERHVRSIENQVRILSQKNYAKYHKKTASRMDYVIMFVPISAAWWEALRCKPSLWRQAMDSNVYIADEQTLFAALRIIKMTWTQIAQVNSQAEIFELVNEMIDRVGQFMKHYTAIGAALKNAQDAYQKAENKLTPGAQSILTTTSKLLKKGGKDSAKNPVGKFLDVDDVEQLPEVGS